MEINDTLDLDLIEHVDLGEILLLTITNKREVFNFNYKLGEATIELRLTKESAVSIAEAIVKLVGTKRKEHSLAV